VSFAAVNLCVAYKRVFIVVSICFVIDSVRKLLDTPSYDTPMCPIFLSHLSPVMKLSPIVWTKFL
jgi:hypothetical protein